LTKLVWNNATFLTKASTPVLVAAVRKEREQQKERPFPEIHSKMKSRSKGTGWRKLSDCSTSPRQWLLRVYQDYSLQIRKKTGFWGCALAALATRRALGRAHVPLTKVFPRLSVNKTILKPRLAAATGGQYVYMGFSWRRVAALIRYRRKQSGSGIRTI